MLLLVLKWYQVKQETIPMKTNAKIDALELMLTDLRTRNEPIRHKAAFRGCQPEIQTLVTKLIQQLEMIAWMVPIQVFQNVRTL